MPDAKDYANARDFRQALDERLKKAAQQQNTSTNDLHRQVVFDRFLARLDSAMFVLTGGYSLELRLPKSRSTTDIDLYLRDPKLVSAKEEEQRQAILYALQQQAEYDMHDYFSFEVERVLGKLHGPKEGGIRCLVIGKVSNKEYHRFHVDVAIVPDQVLEPEFVKPSERLSFAGVESKPVSTLQKEEVFANKIHAYTRPRQAENSRVEDLVTMALLIASGLDKDKVSYALQKVFAASSDHTVQPKQLPSPPASWRKEFEVVADRGSLRMRTELRTAPVQLCIQLCGSARQHNGWSQRHHRIWIRIRMSHRPRTQNSQGAPNHVLLSVPAHRGSSAGRTDKNRVKSIASVVH